MKIRLDQRGLAIAIWSLDKCWVEVASMSGDLKERGRYKKEAIVPQKSRDIQHIHVSHWTSLAPEANDSLLRVG